MPHLVLTMRESDPGDREVILTLGDVQIVVELLQAVHGKARIGFSAPEQVKIERRCIHDANKAAARREQL